MLDEKDLTSEETEETPSAPQEEQAAPRGLDDAIELLSDDNEGEKVEAAVETKTGAEPEADTEEEEEEDLDLPVEPLVAADTAHDDFDWATSTKHGTSYPKEQVEKYIAEYDSTMTAVFENEIVKGAVSAINGGDVVLDINFKSDGIVPLSEFRDMPDLKVGDYVEVYVEQQEDIRG